MATVDDAELTMTPPPFEWDADNIDHIARHGVTPAEAESVFDDPALWYRDVAVRHGEWTYEFVGRGVSGRIIVVVLTPRGGRNRVATAYPASRRVRRLYASR